MIQIKKTILTLALLLTAVTGAWADQLASSYSSNATLNAVTVSASMEVTIATGVTVTINNGLNITSGTLTVTGPGTLIVNGAKGTGGGNGGIYGGTGGTGGVAISGNIIVQGGATVTATGGTGGNGGKGDFEGGNGGTGGNAFAGTLTYKSGTVTANGGSGGSGGWGEDMERSASSGSAGKAFANDVDFTQTTGYSVTNGTSTIESVLNQRKVVISGGSEPAAATTYTVSLKDNVKDADKWTITPTEATTTGVAENTEVTLQYTGRLKVKGVTATSEAAAGKTDLLSGVFSVSSTKKVNFSKGNLQATYNGTDWTWAFAKNQWDYIGNAAGNTSVNGNGTVSASNVTVDLFGWVGASSTWTGAAQYGISNSTATDNTDGYGNVAREALKSDWGNTIGTGWFTLSSDEWQYLFNTRTTGGTVFGTEQARYAQATINTDGTSVKGMILFPDGVSIASTEVTTAGSVNATSAYATKCTTAQWAALAAKGCVFLPAAGNRNEASVYSAGSGGYYWSSSPNTSNVYYAYRVIFLSGNLSLMTQTSRYLGYSVRLVCEVTE